jgi:hypothetical protein
MDNEAVFPKGKGSLGMKQFTSNKLITNLSFCTGFHQYIQKVSKHCVGESDVIKLQI